jgi:hypothetical protein
MTGESIGAFACAAGPTRPAFSAHPTCTHGATSGDGAGASTKCPKLVPGLSAGLLSVRPAASPGQTLRSARGR